MTRDRKVRTGWKIIVALTLIAAGFAVYPYLLFDPGQSRVAIDDSFSLHYPLLLVHIYVSFLALLIGWLQFLPSLRARKPHLHRMVGRLYLGFVVVGGISGLVVGMYTESYVRQMAFLTLVALWLFTGWKGYSAARRKQFDAHGMWMTRNYALTLVAASARLVTPICILVYLAGHWNEPFQGVPAILEHVLEVNIWVGLVLNFAISEWVIISRLIKR
ncbi:DUF2306 domain-containing protein [Paenibacillus spongiae]|uniref:DUF2306 domain-containing protein n=1 Tax=Paenibacillus spongiae TaxID=2909671 RepID=A0ABY5S0Z8_9BACL|nr:DUF2306 domain-containing protein [Paenibacillus spongiae]UVI27319.1 DUF2306 domain-containing protein [Paenibacillus spongiae]